MAKKLCHFFFKKIKILCTGICSTFFIIIAKWRNFDPKKKEKKKMQLTQCKKIGRKEKRKKNPPLR
jgi:hypothetical protein